jgi:hypothetical protein
MNCFQDLTLEVESTSSKAAGKIESSLARRGCHSCHSDEELVYCTVAVLDFTMIMLHLRSLDSIKRVRVQNFVDDGPPVIMRRELSNG